MGPFDLKHKVNLFDFLLGKMKVLKCSCRENEILAYLVTKFDKWEDWKCPFIWDFSLYDYKFDQ